LAGKEEKPRFNMNRPHVQKNHPSGVYVIMYKDKPGVYFDHGERELPAAFAKAAGFETEKLARLAQLQLDRGAMNEAIAKAMSAEEYEVVETRATYRLVSIGNGFFHIEMNESGERISPMPMIEVVARASFDQLDAKVEEDAPLLFGKGKAA
jgi:hypothetical protein